MLSSAELRNLVDYNSLTGEFRWLVSRTNRIRIGILAAHPGKNKYLRVRIGEKLYLAHRLAWLYVTGEWPRGEIDHADRNPHNNAIANLRDTTPIQNKQNQSLRSDNTSGVKGVTWCEAKQKWQAQIVVNKKNKQLGRFDSFSLAVAARRSAEESQFGQYAAKLFNNI